MIRIDKSLQEEVIKVLADNNYADGTYQIPFGGAVILVSSSKDNMLPLNEVDCNGRIFYIGTFQDRE